MNSTSTLIFDLVGVIINLKSGQDWQEQDRLRNFHPEPLHQLQQQHFFHDFETGKIASADFVRQLKSIALKKDVSDETIIRHWNSILKDIPLHRVELMQQLKQRYRLVLLSNTNSIHVESFQRYMQQQFGEDILRANFHTIYYSQEIGLRKPNKEIYEFVLQEQGIIPSETIFFDDKPENLLEPQKLGWQTVHVPFNHLSISDIQHLLF